MSSFDRSLAFLDPLLCRLGHGLSTPIQGHFNNHDLKIPPLGLVSLLSRNAMMSNSEEVCRPGLNQPEHAGDAVKSADSYAGTEVRYFFITVGARFLRLKPTPRFSPPSALGLLR